LEADFTLSYLKTKDGVEIDLVVTRPGKAIVLIEIKSAERIIQDAYKSLLAFRNDFKKPVFCVFCQEPAYRTITEGGNEIHIFPWQDGIKFLFNLAE